MTDRCIDLVKLWKIAAVEVGYQWQVYGIRNAGFDNLPPDSEMRVMYARAVTDAEKIANAANN